MIQTDSTTKNKQGPPGPCCELVTQAWHASAKLGALAVASHACADSNFFALINFSMFIEHLARNAPI